jgi:L-ascorbate metabolism protein UlaG (beta-lactamase superfamily)
MIGSALKNSASSLLLQEAEPAMHLACRFCFSLLIGYNSRRANPTPWRLYLEIDWFGHACFRLKSREATLITDPYAKEIGLAFPRPRGDIVTISHDHPGHSFSDGVKGEPKLVLGPGEYEIRNVFITGIQTSHDKKGSKERGANTVYVIETDGLRICHLGDLGHVPTQPQAEAMGDVDVLLVPVGGVSTVTGNEAAEIVSMLEPHIVIPMHFANEDLKFKLETTAKFFKEMGSKAPKPIEMLKITKDSLPAETQIILFEAKQKE